MGTIVGVPLSIALAPITIPIFFATGLYNDHGGMTLIILPVIGTTYGFYYVGTTCAYPVYLCALPFRSNDFSRMTNKEKVATIIEQMPYISEEDYNVLRKASGRKLAPNYDDVFTDPYYHGDSISYGRMAHKIDYKTTEEWQSWLKAEKPAGLAERRFTVKYLYANMASSDFRALQIICQQTGMSLKDVDEFCKARGKVSGSNEQKLSYWIRENGGIDAILSNKIR